MSQSGMAAVILAAGKSTRMRSELPKVLHPVCGRPMLAYVVDACRAAGAVECVVVVGHRKESVIAAFAGEPGLRWVEQAEQKGTGHAVGCAREAIQGFEHVLVVCGDGPLIRGTTLRALVGRHVASGAAATLATAELNDPTGYGRILRDADGRFVRIVEHNDCTPAQRAVREVNPSYYAFRTADLLSALDELSPDNAKGEYYLTDAFAGLLRRGRPVEAFAAVPADEVRSINARHELALINETLQRRIQQAAMEAGVTLVAPSLTWIEDGVRFGADTVIHPFCRIGRGARIGGGCLVGPFASVAAGAVIADGAVVGPFPGSPS